MAIPYFSGEFFAQCCNARVLCTAPLCSSSYDIDHGHAVGTGVARVEATDNSGASETVLPRSM